MTNLFLITGFLGSGKTTLLKHLLLQQNGSVGVLVNEFGKIDIDGERLTSSGVTPIKLTNGSIFCACLKDDFLQALAQLLKQGLDTIFIESSGLSDPSNMGTILQQLRLQAVPPFHYKGTVCVVDGKYFLPTLERMVNTERQIQHSSWILVNKCDLIDSATKEATTRAIQQIHPGVPIHFITEGVFDAAILQEQAAEEFPAQESSNTEENRPLTYSITLGKEFTPNTIEQFIAEIQHQFYRIKGSIRYQKSWYHIDSVYGTIIVEQQELTPPLQVQQLVCIAATGITSLSALSLACKNLLVDGYTIET